LTDVNHRAAEGNFCDKYGNRSQPCNRRQSHVSNSWTFRSEQFCTPHSFSKSSYKNFRLAFIWGLI